MSSSDALWIVIALIVCAALGIGLLLLIFYFKEKFYDDAPYDPN